MALRVRAGIVCALLALPLAAAAPSASADVVAISTQPTLYPSFDPQITDYVTRCTGGTPVGVIVSASGDTAVTVDGQGARTGTFTAQVSLTAGRAFRIEATSGSAVSTYYVRCLPSDFPSWTFQRLGQPQVEWYMTSPSGTLQPPAPPGISLNYVAIFDTHGVPVWWSRSVNPGDFKLFSNGNLGWIPSGGTGLEERRLDGTLVRAVRPVSAGIDGHEFLLLPNGNYLVATARTGPEVSLCGQSNVPVLDNGAQEIAPDGSLVWEWWASEHISTTEVPPEWCGAVFNFGNDAYHINSIEPDGDGFVMSFRHLDAVYRVNKSDGSIAWKLGGTTRPESLTVLDDPLSTGPDIFRGQHDARVLGDGTLTVHDNGFHANSSRGPRAVRYAIDTSARTATLVEQKNDPGPPLTALCCGMARKLPGGNWVMAWGSSGLITELDPSGNRITSLQFDDQIFSYRAHPVLPGPLSRIALRDGMDAQFPRDFVRPRGTLATRVPLVPAFNQCVSPDATHGGPLAFGSCRSPAGTSSFLTIGTPDANDAGSRSTGFVAYRARLGNSSTPANEADVRVRVGLNDVRLKSDLSDYTGELQVRGEIRITDRNNGPLQNEGATGFDTEFPVTVPCAPTASAPVGATCSVSSTVNAILPGTVVEGKRAVWQLGQVQVFDGGATGQAGAPDATLFETQGLFLP